MRVLHICDYSARYRGNFIETMDVLRKKLEENNDEMFYAFPHRILGKNNAWLSDLQKETKVFIYPEGTIEKTGYFRDIVKTEDIDIVHTHFTDLKNDMMITAACAGLKVKKIKHYRMLLDVWSKTKRIVSRFCYKSWDSVLCVSPAVKEVTIINIKSCRSLVVKDAIVFDRLEKYETLKKSDYNIPEDASVCFMMGYDYISKGIDLAVKAIGNIRKTHNVVLTVCVASNAENIRAEIKNDVGCLPDWIVILEPREDIASYYLFADIVIEPSRSEGFCYAIVEAAYCQKPVVASDCEGMTSHAKGVLDILWFKNADADDLKEKIGKALELKDNAQLLKNNKEAAILNYDANNLANEIMKIYRE